jgi:hypothetical protein
MQGDKKELEECLQKAFSTDKASRGSSSKFDVANKQNLKKILDKAMSSDEAIAQNCEQACADNQYGLREEGEH